MILFKPVVTDGDILCYAALDENNEKCGECTFTLGGYNMCVLSLEGEDTVKEGLLRSSLNFCANRGAYLAELKCGVTPAAERLGFNENVLIREIPDALASTCCKYELE